MSFDLSNVHLVTTDGRGSVLQMSPVNLVVKPTPPVTKPATEEATAPKVESTETPAPPTAAPAVTNPPTSTASPQTTAPDAINPPVATATVGSPATAAPKQWRQSPKPYVIHDGDNLWKIAAANRVTVAALRQANPRLSGDALTVGRRLLIP
jgi:LysM repeat protein